MRFHPSHTLKLCLGTLLAALLLGLQNADEYADDMACALPEQQTNIDKLRRLAEATGLPAYFRAQKTILSDIDDYLRQLTDDNTPAAAKETPQIIVRYIRIPTPAQLNTYRADSRRETEPALLPEQLLNQGKQVCENEPLQPSPEPPQPSSEPEPETPTSPEPEPVIPQEETPAPAPPPTKEEIAAANLESPVRCRIMMLGDSLMEDLGPQLHRRLRHRPGLHFILTAKYSTGLSRPDYFNWPRNMELAVSQTHPDIIIFFMGANDAMPIRSRGKALYPAYGEPWRSAYREKMNELFEIARRHSCEILWVGLPPMGSKYADLLRQTTLAQKEACSEQSIRYIDTTYILGDDAGQFRVYLDTPDGKAIRLRAKDKEHITPEGNSLILEQIIPELEQKIADFRQKHPERCLTDAEKKPKHPARLEITIKYKPGKK